MKLLELEWHYLSDDCKAMVKELLANGVADVELAVEMAINKLGDEHAFDLGGAHEKRRD